GYRTSTPVLEPLLRRLVTADVEGPSNLRHAVEILVLVDVDATLPSPLQGRGGRRVSAGRRGGAGRRGPLSQPSPLNGIGLPLREAACHHVVARAVVRVGCLADGGRFHQVKAAELLALFADVAEDFR